MEIKRYNATFKQEWDSFVRASRNGTFLLCRDFMDYHSDRFTDLSFMFYNDSTLVAVMPGNESDGVCYSHQGLTYGGLIMSPESTAAEVLCVFDLLLQTLRHQGFSRMVYKAIPYIYHKSPSDEDLYALFRAGAVLSARYLSSALSLSDSLSYARTRKNGLKKASKHGLIVGLSEDYKAFWQILSHNLDEKYNTDPVHSLAEIQMLKDRFPDEIRLYAAFDGNGTMLAGTVAFITDTLVHLQYTAGSVEGKKCGAVDLLVDHIITEVSVGKRYFDYGHSNEQGGAYLNEKLIYQKEGFGARGIACDIYTIHLQ